MIDVLHALDLGVSQSALGNLFFEFWRSPLSKERNRKLKTVELWNLVKEYYKEFRPPTKINALTVEMVEQDGKSPKFRGKGAETRHLVPFGLILAEKMAAAAGGTSIFYNQLAIMMRHLLAFYQTFTETTFNPKTASNAANQFCQIYAWFNKTATHEGLWKFKPKFHLFVHLAEDQCLINGNPARFGAFMDEDFVGFIATIAVARGGKRIAITIPVNVIDKYRSSAV